MIKEAKPLKTTVHFSIGLMDALAHSQSFSHNQEDCEEYQHHLGSYPPNSSPQNPMLTFDLLKVSLGHDITTHMGE